MEKHLEKSQNKLEWVSFCKAISFQLLSEWGETFGWLYIIRQIIPKPWSIIYKAEVKMLFRLAYWCKIVGPPAAHHQIDFSECILSGRSFRIIGAWYAKLRSYYLVDFLYWWGKVWDLKHHAIRLTSSVHTVSRFKKMFKIFQITTWLSYDNTDWLVCW